MYRLLATPALALLATLAAPSPLSASIIDYSGMATTTYNISATGFYTITAYGAEGGSSTTNAVSGGFGAELFDQFYLMSGDQLTIAVGQEGLSGTRAGGGGGMTIVYDDTTNSILLVAGGGGGAGLTSTGQNASLTTAGGTTTGGGSGGTNGNGGAGGLTSPSKPNAGGGGAGFFSGGTAGTGPNPGGGGFYYTSAVTPLFGGAGGTSTLAPGAGGNGGYGGGGGGAYSGGGGGGGYSGGGGGAGQFGGGGGSSLDGLIDEPNYFIATASFYATTNGNGQVIIVPATVPAVPEPSSLILISLGLASLIAIRQRTQG